MVHGMKMPILRKWYVCYGIRTAMVVLPHFTGIYIISYWVPESQHGVAIGDIFSASFCSFLLDPFILWYALLLPLWNKIVHFVPLYFGIVKLDLYCVAAHIWQIVFSVRWDLDFGCLSSVGIIKDHWNFWMLYWNFVLWNNYESIRKKDGKFWLRSDVFWCLVDKS